MKPRLLDLYCGAGGSAMGWHRAGFDVTGVDIAPQPDYPFEFHQGDALDFLAEHGHEFDARHASPPCQASCALTKGTNKGRTYLNLIPATREALATFDGPSVIENVQGADIRRDLTLCGEMFGLGVIRHRYFELSGFTAAQPKHRKHRGRVAGYRHGQWYEGPYFAVYGDVAGRYGHRLDRRPQEHRRGHPARLFPLHRAPPAGAPARHREGCRMTAPKHSRREPTP